MARRPRRSPARRRRPKAKAVADAQEQQANLALVSGSKWYTYQYDYMEEIDAEGDPIKKISLGPTKEFTTIGPSKMRNDFWCKEVVSRTGQRCWVTEEELKQFSNM